MDLLQKGVRHQRSACVYKKNPSEPSWPATKPGCGGRPNRLFKPHQHTRSATRGGGALPVSVCGRRRPARRAVLIVGMAVVGKVCIMISKAPCLTDYLTLSHYSFSPPRVLFRAALLSTHQRHNVEAASFNTLCLALGFRFEEQTSCEDCSAR